MSMCIGLQSVNFVTGGNFKRRDPASLIRRDPASLILPR